MQSIQLTVLSDLLQGIATSLWSRLSEEATLYHQRVVELFLQLHNLTSVPFLCTNVIGNSLVDIKKVGSI